MVIDAHQHFWRFNPVRDAWITEDMSAIRRDFLPADLAPELDANGVDATIAVQADQSEAETEFLLGLAEGNRRIAGVVGWVDLRAADVERRLEHFSQFKKLRGVRHVAQGGGGRSVFGAAGVCARRWTFEEFRTDLRHFDLSAAVAGGD